MVTTKNNTKKQWFAPQISDLDTANTLGAAVANPDNEGGHSEFSSGGS